MATATERTQLPHQLYTQGHPCKRRLKRTHYKAVLTRANQSTTAMDFRRVGGQLWIYADHKAEWALIPKYVVWFSEQTTAATNSLTQGTSGKPTQARRPHKSTTCQLGEQVASQLKPSTAIQEHNLLKAKHTCCDIKQCTRGQPARVTRSS